MSLKNTLSNIKSKREKLQDKRAQKGLSRKAVVILSSDDDEPKKNVIEVEPTPPEVAKQTKNSVPQTVKEYLQQKFNKFNYSNLAKMDPNTNNADKQGLLKFSQLRVGPTIDVVDTQTKNNLQTYKPYYFKVLGSTREFTVKDIGLQDKVTIELVKIEKAELQKQKKQEQKEKEVVVEVTKDKNTIDIDSEDEIKQKKTRYFQVSHQICFKCGKEGHFAKNCIWADDRKCKVCFGRTHEEWNCPQICFKCGSLGHISNDCPVEASNFCTRCQKRGHREDICGVIIQHRNIRSIDQFFTESDLKKLKCLNDGQHDQQFLGKPGRHFNCFNYQPSNVMPYHQLRNHSSFATNGRHNNYNNRNGSYRGQRYERQDNLQRYDRQDRQQRYNSNQSSRNSNNNRQQQHNSNQYNQRNPHSSSQQHNRHQQSNDNRRKSAQERNEEEHYLSFYRQNNNRRRY